MRAEPISVPADPPSRHATHDGTVPVPRAGDAIASAILVAMFLLSIAWIAKDVVPRFQSSPVSAPLQYTVLDGYSKLAVSSIDAGAPVELGVAIRPTVAGTVIGLRFFKITGDLGPHVGSVWSRKGERLASVTFYRESESGWQEALFETPVDVQANQLLVASYFAPVGGQIVSDPSVLDGSAPQRAPSPYFRVPPFGDEERPTNLYHPGGPGFPTVAGGNAPFWVDIVFVPASASP